MAIRSCSRSGVKSKSSFGSYASGWTLSSCVLNSPVDVLGQARRDVGKVLGGDLPSLVQQLPHGFRDVQGVGSAQLTGVFPGFRRQLMINPTRIGDEK